MDYSRERKYIYSMREYGVRENEGKKMLRSENNLQKSYDRNKREKNGRNNYKIRYFFSKTNA